MEGILSDVMNPKIILENITSREKYLSAKRSEKMIEDVSIKNQPRSEKPKQASSCNNYSDFTRETFIDRMLETLVKRGVVSKVARDLNINYRTAVVWWQLYNETEDIAYKKSEQNRGQKSSFTTAHNEYINELLDNDQQLVSDDIMGNLTKKSDGFTISKSQLNNHLRNTMFITIKKPVFEAEVRNSAENLQTSYEWFMKWKGSDLDYTRNRIFIEQAGFNINMRYN
ncbi:hypothetical protein G6F57_014185 [Rhizopus arrhizus]|uniref:Uncharacterized protein n=1 Tax=Rhizopus oryzae TaxID=64495 RepID=A0A9P6WWW4_RHIOR|nr:hypothetical protein G6F24_012550 [Rhizopus arrhizus]KAG1399232.1 hypothetical protein G6F58_011170 [Rhizopus delemar]KAG0776920.1 hypothetical protein G6F22_012228 [Rhizopus arrhizus]KAG0780242.1 hypothetical protein G6F21_012222 [Rhizopus arrhizus]KAG0804451.1 hypothetical protein G6F20_012687 [Rhizopus arrhizus]